jgi:SnoaL-like protein
VQRNPLMALAREDVAAWLTGYERAWCTAGTAPLGELFTEGATYRMSPYEDAATGLAEIGALWERERQGPDEEFAMTHEIVAADGDTAVVKLEVQYGGPERLQYRDLWILRFAGDGRCREFEEWPFWPGQQIIAKGGDQ